LIECERYLLTVSRYIELNPVRAKMVEHPSDYPWSSYQSNGEGKTIALLTPHECYLALGADEGNRQAAYRALFEQEIPASRLSEIRNSIDQTWILGDDRFTKQIEAQIGRRAVLAKHGGDRRSKDFVASKESTTLTP